MKWAIKSRKTMQGWRGDEVKPSQLMTVTTTKVHCRMHVVTCFYDDVSAFILLSTSILANQPPSVVLTATYFGAILCLNFGHQYKLVPD